MECEGVEAQRETLRPLVNRLLCALSVLPPDLTLPVPPTDNRRLIRGRQGRLVLSGAARSYLATCRPIFGKRSPKTGHVLMVYKVYFTSRRRDGGNCMKILKDTLYNEDKNVLGWELPSGVDTRNPRVEVYLVELPEASTDESG